LGLCPKNFIPLQSLARFPEEPFSRYDRGKQFENFSFQTNSVKKRGFIEPPVRSLKA
jgi:hypothetical protein